MAAAACAWSFRLTPAIILTSWELDIPSMLDTKEKRYFFCLVLVSSSFIKFFLYLRHVKLVLLRNGGSCATFASQTRASYTVMIYY
jgi:hypothetical protein